jgi:phosphoribosylamine--glycine ligase
MKVLIVGNGGREHAIAWKTSQSPSVKKIYCAPGNAGIASLADCVDIEISDITSLKNFALMNNIDLTIVGPELPLTLGIVDAFEEEGLRIFGPSKKAALLEGSKLFAKNIMKSADIPTADYSVFSDPELAKKYIKEKKSSLVIKADGLAAGKGVFPCRTTQSALDAVDRIMIDREFGDAGDTILIEDFLDGEEASFICFTDGKTVVPLPSSQDHKSVYDYDKGPNTGGMGAYSPAPVVTPQVHEFVMKKIMVPLVQSLSLQGIKYKGIIYAGLMIKNGFPNVLEFNVRLGDPETEPILFRLKSDFIEIINSIIDENLSEVSINLDYRPSVCVVMASEGYPGKYKNGYEIIGIDEAEKVPNSFIFHAGTSIENGHLVTNGGRVICVTSRGETIQEAIATVYSVVKKIHWNGVHFRNDIGRKAVAE